MKRIDKICAGASLTVETALVLPLFMFFCIQLMSIIGLLQVHSVLEAAMHQEVSRVALEAYAAETALSEVGVSDLGVVGDLATEAYLVSRVVNRAGREYLDNSMIEGGSGGIRMIPHQKDTEQDTVDLILAYEVRPIVDILGFSKFTMGNRVRMKKWTGYVLDPVAESREEDEWVYIAENGTVYHKNRNCTHIMLSIEPVSLDSLSGHRNNGGEKYHSCELCGGKAGKNVFITGEGNRYHSSLGCSGLKRTIYVVRKSEVMGRGACSRCGG